MGSSMKRLGFSYRVKAGIELPEADVDFLIELSKRHYDFTCKNLSVPGRGAILNGMKNSVEDGVAKINLDSREVNLLLKVLELPHDRDDLVEGFVELFQAIKAEAERLDVQA